MPGYAVLVAQAEDGGHGAWSPDLRFEAARASPYRWPPFLDLTAQNECGPLAGADSAVDLNRDSSASIRLWTSTWTSFCASR